MHTDRSREEEMSDETFVDTDNRIALPPLCQVLAEQKAKRKKRKEKRKSSWKEPITLTMEASEPPQPGQERAPALREPERERATIHLPLLKRRWWG